MLRLHVISGPAGQLQQERSVRGRQRYTKCTRRAGRVRAATGSLKVAWAGLTVRARCGGLLKMHQGQS